MQNNVKRIGEKGGMEGKEGEGKGRQEGRSY